MLPLKPIHYLLGVGLLLVPGGVSAQAVGVDLLKNMREKIVFPELSAEEKKLLAEQANSFLRDLYVHRFQKPFYYFWQQDPAIPMAEVVKNADKMSTDALEHAIYSIFAEQRDLHLNYTFPEPHGRYTSFLPLTFARTAGNSNFFEARVSAVNKAVFARFVPGQRVPAIGDELIAYNGGSVGEAAWKLSTVGQGANLYGAFGRALQAMTVRSHCLQEVPCENEATLCLRAHRPDGKGECYTITLPWLVKWGGTVRQEKVFVSPQEEYGAFIRENGLENRSSLPANPSAEPALTWGKIKNEDGNFGYLKLTSFSTATGIEGTVNEIRRLLIDELADTDGLVFDVRSNGGGAAMLAESLPQLFTPSTIQPTHSRLLNSDLNHRLFSETDWHIFSPEKKDALDEVKGKSCSHTRPVLNMPQAMANQLGQAYYKPVAVLANADSYSATDFFTCGMQDNGAGVIFGEDPRTGAGGAQVLSHAEFVQFGLPDVFKPLPKGHAMRVSWSQGMRSGLHAGDIIEDDGCSADVDISRTAQDLITGGEDQLKKITRHLAKMGCEKAPFVRCDIRDAHSYVAGVDARFNLYVKNTPIVKIYLNGKLMDKVAINAMEKECALEYALPVTLSSGMHHVTFVGQGWHGEKVWNLKRRVTLLKERAPLNEQQGLELDFSTMQSPEPLTIIHQDSEMAKAGWAIESPYLQIGTQSLYASDIDTEALLRLDMRGKKEVLLTFDASLDTELDCDMLQVYASDGENAQKLLQISGKQDMQTWRVDLSPYAGKDNVLLRFRFISDQMITGKGVKIARISVR